MVKPAIPPLKSRRASLSSKGRRSQSPEPAAGLFAAAGLFVIATCFVGLIALYRWVAITCGQFWGFGAVALVLLALAGACAGMAMAQTSPSQSPSRKRKALRMRNT